MKKIMIGVMVGIFVLVGLVSGMMTIITDHPENYAQSEQYERYNVEIQVNKGWNLIASGFIFDKELDYLDESGDIKKENIKVVYVYSNKINEYLSSYPIFDERASSGDRRGFINGDEVDFIGQANWVYIDKSGILKYKTKSIKVLDSTKLFAGWNFVSITPEMFYEKGGQEVFSWNGVNGNCNFKKIYAWNPEEQDWVQISPDLESFDFDDFIGNGMVVKVSSDCNLGSLGSGTGGVPQLPSGNREELRERYYLSFYANTCEIDQFLEAYYESELDCDNVAKCYALEASQLIPEKDLNSLLYEVKISENVFQIIPNYFKNDQLLDTQFEEKATNCLVNNNYKGEFL
jgi:hypothetical protein